jgi:RNA polymerase sigma-70 factor, ECF subfamily
VSSGVATEPEFVRATERYRRELVVHCYRMLGSVDDAEDVVQETYIRAWRAYSGFEGRASVRTWLYQIATNATLTALEHRSRRVLPSGLGAPSDDPATDAVPAGPGVRWIEPIPDALIAPESEDPAAIVAARAGVRLALIASLQRLPARQRAVLILRDVLSFRAHEVAAMLGTSTAAVKSALQRARAALEDAGAGELTEPGEPRARSLLEQYMTAFERSDMSLLERALRDDAALEMAGSTTWFAGKRTCVPYIRRFLRNPGDWRMLPTVANGQPAALAYQRDRGGVYAAYAVAVLTVSAAGIGRITLFSDAGVLERFGARITDGAPP